MKRLTLTVMITASSLFSIIFTPAQAQLTNYIGCLNDPLPFTPGVPNFTLFAANRIGLASLTLWRQTCLNNANRSVLLVQIAPFQSPAIPSFVTGSNINIYQAGRRLGPFTLKQGVRDALGFSGWLQTTDTFILGQSNNGNPLVDERMAFTMTYSTGAAEASLQIPNFQGVGPTSAALEFTHEGRYFTTADENEKRAVESGAAGSWAATGASFLVLSEAVDSAKAVYRYWDKQGQYHHYSTDATLAERDANLSSEGRVYYVFEAVNGQCGEGQRPLFVLNNIDGRQRLLTADRLPELENLAQKNWQLREFKWCIPQ